jgi:hypothetical protein
MRSRLRHTSAPRLAVVVALLSLSTAPAWAGDFASAREDSAPVSGASASAPDAAGSVYAVDPNGVIVKSPRKVRTRADGDSIVLQPADSAVQIRVEPGAGGTADRAVVKAQAALNAAQGNVYALAGNDGGIVRATEARVINGRLWLIADGDTSVADAAPGATRIASIAP